MSFDLKADILKAEEEAKGNQEQHTLGYVEAEEPTCPGSITTSATTEEDVQDAQFIPVEKRRPEFSKVIAVIGLAMWIIVNLYAMVIITITLDLSALEFIIGSANAVVAIVYTTYSIKAKAENMIKLKKIYGYDAESVIDALLKKYSEYEE